MKSLRQYPLTPNEVYHEPDPVEIPGESMESTSNAIAKNMAICMALGLAISIGLVLAGFFLFG